eukprot:COSAG06_NODE_412_length_16042_cov_52.419934_17_plen_116_part_00
MRKTSLSVCTLWSVLHWPGLYLVAKQQLVCLEPYVHDDQVDNAVLIEVACCCSIRHHFGPRPKVRAYDLRGKEASCSVTKQQLVGLRVVVYKNVIVGIVIEVAAADACIKTARSQ